MPNVENSKEALGRFAIYKESYQFILIDRGDERFLVDEPEIRGLDLPVQDIADEKSEITLGGRTYNLHKSFKHKMATYLDYFCEEYFWG